MILDGSVFIQLATFSQCNMFLLIIAVLLNFWVICAFFLNSLCTIYIDLENMPFLF